MTLDAIGLEVMGNAFAGIAEEMGAALVASSRSPNIRERRDSSAALFDADGLMTAQAAHIPVHLGAMPDAVAAVSGLRPEPGSTYIINDPFMGGTHLPDITLVHAIRLSDIGAPAAFTVVRAHHADVGGARPGSMPTDSRELLEEGLVIPPVRWAVDGVVDANVERLVLANVRAPGVRKADLAAQLAACELGADRYRALVARSGRTLVEGGARDLLDYAERRTVEAIRRKVSDGRYEARDVLEGDGVIDDDIPVSVAITARAGRLRIDFTGTSPAVAGNVNCPRSVTRSAVLFVVRCLVGEDIPTNAGVERAVDLVIPDGCLLDARWPRAVAAGNVETSQRVADLLFRALEGVPGVPADGQGTMNNVVLGGDGWTYYETLGGGQGALPHADGPSAVHVGMSNTRNTPVEVLEMEHPVRVVTYAVRRKSGGSGQHHGGDGVIREMEALAPVEVSLISERRRHAPEGRAGGGSGAPGRNSMDGNAVGGRAHLRLTASQRLRVETPGGGGRGRGA